MPSTPANTAGGPVPWDFPTEEFCGIAFIGEAPGRNEVAIGHPLVGEAGRVFNGILDDLGVDRAACIVGNVFRWRPTDNKIDHFFTNKSASAGRKINEIMPKMNGLHVLDEFSEDISYLYRQIMTYKPKITIAMGNTPLWALTGHSGITTLRGSPLEPIRFASKPNFLLQTRVLPTFHPAVAVPGRKLHYRPIILNDMALALEMANVKSGAAPDAGAEDKAA